MSTESPQPNPADINVMAAVAEASPSGVADAPAAVEAQPGAPVDAAAPDYAPAGPEASPSFARKVANRVLSRLGRSGLVAVNAGAVIYGMTSAQEGSTFCGHEEQTSSWLDSV